MRFHLASAIVALSLLPRPALATDGEELPLQDPIREAEGLRVEGLRVQGLIQGQYERDQQSADELQPGGRAMNRDRFVVRRARVRAEYTRSIGVAQLEFDANTVQQPTVRARLANVGLRFAQEGEAESPWLDVRVGLSEIPFGWETPNGQRTLGYAERTQGARALFPGQTDVGLRASGALGAFRYDFAVTNGTPLSETGTASLADPTAAPDLVLRLGAEARIEDTLELRLGTSMLLGTGFHPGTDAEKPRVEWRDLNENDSLDTGELIAVPGRAAQPSETFGRWAAGVDGLARLRVGISETRLTAEAVVAANLDRALMVADPVAVGADVRHVAWNVGVVQTLWGRAVLGARYDEYDPDSDFLDERQGYRVPQDARIRTLAIFGGGDPVAGVRVLTQYEFVWDRLARDESGVPTDLANNRFLLRVQGAF